MMMTTFFLHWLVMMYSSSCFLYLGGAFVFSILYVYNFYISLTVSRFLQHFLIFSPAIKAIKVTVKWNVSAFILA